MKTEKRNYVSLASKAFTIATLVLGLAFVIYGMEAGIFKSKEALTGFIGQAGIFGPFLFIFIQALQVVIPALPGFVTCIAGAIVFGPFLGFLYSYIGMCIGSILAFYIARKYGTEFVKKFVSEATYEKYASWLEKGNKFDILFAAAIFLPAAPDDLLCFLAGLTKMTAKRFTAIILLGKPFVIALYSLGVAGFSQILTIR